MEKAELGLFRPEERAPLGGPYCCLQLPNGRVQKRHFLEVQRQDKRQWTPTGTWEIPIKYRKRLFPLRLWSNTGTGGLDRWRISVPGSVQNSTRQQQHDLGAHALRKVTDHMALGSPFHLKLFSHPPPWAFTPVTLSGQSYKPSTHKDLLFCF